MRVSVDWPLRPLWIVSAPGDAEMVKLALGMVGKLIGIDDLSGELLALAIDYIAEHREEGTE